MRIAREAKQKAATKTAGEAEDDVGLGVAQIVITAATPMEEVDRPFPGMEEEEEEQKDAEPPAEPTPEEPPPTEETEEQPAEPEPTAKSKLKHGDSEEKAVVDDQPADSAPFPVSSSSGSDAESVSGPSTGDNSQCLPAQRTGGATAADEEEPAEPPPTGKMLVGGRASIPDELQPDQLQKLQNLKESNA